MLVEPNDEHENVNNPFEVGRARVHRRTARANAPSREKIRRSAPGAYREALDAVMNNLIRENVERERRSRVPQKGQDFGPISKRRRFEVCAQAMRNNASDDFYNFSTESCDFCECFVTAQDVKRMMAVLYGRAQYDPRNQALGDSEASFAKNFNFAERAIADAVQPDYLAQLVRWRMDAGGVMRFGDAVAFRVDVADVNRYTFPKFMFPDLRR